MKKILFQEGGAVEQREKLPYSVYRYQKAPAGSRRGARRFARGLDDKYLNYETGYNPYFNVNEYGQPVSAGLNNNEYDRDYAFALRYGNNDWYETYDADGNLIDYDYGDVDPEKQQVIWDNLRAAGHKDFDEQYIDNGNGTYTIRRKTPLIEDKEIVFYSPLNKISDAAQGIGSWFGDAAQGVGDWFDDVAKDIKKDIREKKTDYYRRARQKEINRRLKKSQKNSPSSLPCNEDCDDQFSGLVKRNFRR